MNGRPARPPAGRVPAGGARPGDPAAAGHGPAVVSEVSFAVRPGDVLGLVGESGSGKTTVALALLGHTRRGLSVSRGEILLDGLDLLRLRPPRLRQVRGARVSYVPQDPSAALNPALRIGYQLREALRVHRRALAADPGKRILEVLSEVRLEASPAMLRRYPHQLSGGQQQRVALAMAFACRPSLIVLDEPTTGLDVSTQRHILDTVRSLCRGLRGRGRLRQPRPGRGQRAGRRGRRHVRRPDRRGRPRGPAVRRPLHPYTRGLLASVPGPERGGPLAGYPRPAAAARRPRARVRVRPPLRPRARPVPGPRAGTGRGGRADRALPAGGRGRTVAAGAPGPRSGRPRPAAGPPGAACCPSGGFRSITARCRCCPASTWTCRRGRASPWSASPARARRRWPAASSGCTGTGPAR